MTPRHILFYVSGHGFGHARRTVAIIRSLLRRHPAVRVSVRTTAPASIFTAVGLVESAIAPSTLDAGVVERDVLTIDVPKSVEKLRGVLSRRQQIIAEETAAIVGSETDLIVADIPFLAGDIAAELRIPCIASGNFTWDWICAPFFAGEPDGASVMESVTAGYAKMTAVLRQPFSHPMPQFARVVDVPMVVHCSGLGPEQILHHLGLDPEDERPRVLIAMRGGTSPAAIDAAVRSSPDFLFTALQTVPDRAPENLRGISTDGLDFCDLLSVHDLVISKLGYGMVCDGIAAGVRVLWPRREGFREDALFEAEAPKYLRMRELSRDDYAAGRWGDGLSALIASDFEPADFPSNGDNVCADLLAKGSLT